MNSNDNFLTFEEFQNRFEIKAYYLHFFQLIAAIPPHLKRKAFGSTLPDLLGATSEYCQIEDRTIVLTKFAVKIITVCSSRSLFQNPPQKGLGKKAFQNFRIGVIVL